MSSKNTFELTLKSVPQNVDKIEKFVNKINKKARLNEINFHKVLVSTTEAVNNAIIHGNKSDPGKSIFLRCSLQNEQLVMSVKDEGKGFNPENLPNPIAEENIMKETGRGIFLMRTLMDEVEFHFNSRGCEVLMSLYIGPSKKITEFE